MTIVGMFVKNLKFLILTQCTITETHGTTSTPLPLSQPDTRSGKSPAVLSGNVAVPSGNVFAGPGKSPADPGDACRSKGERQKNFHLLPQKDGNLLQKKSTPKEKIWNRSKEESLKSKEEHKSKEECQAKKHKESKEDETKEKEFETQEKKPWWGILIVFSVVSGS